MMHHYLRTTRVAALFAFLLLFVFIVPFHAYGQAGKSCLFKVTSSKSTVYLLGSVHVMQESAYPLSGAIEGALQKSSDVIFEVHLGEMDSPKAQEVIMQKSFFTDGNTLRKVLKPATYRKLEEAMQPLGLNAAQLDQLKPWSVAMALVMFKMNQLGYSPEAGVDRYIYGKAVAASKKVSGLETIEWQLGLLDGLDMAQQDMLVSQTLDDFTDMVKTVEEMMTAWKNGDVNKIEQMIAGSFQAYPDLYDTLFSQRNKRWLSKVEDLLAQRKTSFVVVGVGHLVGRDSLVDLLRRKGYTVEQL